MPTSADHLPPFEPAFPGPLRDKLVAAVLSGAKTATTGLLAGYEAENEPLPKPGERSALLDSQERRVAVVEITDVQVLPLGEIGPRHAVDEGEGYGSVAWSSPNASGSWSDCGPWTERARACPVDHSRAATPIHRTASEPQLTPAAR
ncbi:ASCH domain-containing protein [Streptomyces chattanoogensis]